MTRHKLIILLFAGAGFSFSGPASSQKPIADLLESTVNQLVDAKRALADTQVMGANERCIFDAGLQEIRRRTKEDNADTLKDTLSLKDNCLASLDIAAERGLETQTLFFLTVNENPAIDRKSKEAVTKRLLEERTNPIDPSHTDRRYNIVARNIYNTAINQRPNPDGTYPQSEYMGSDGEVRPLTCGLAVSEAYRRARHDGKVHTMGSTPVELEKADLDKALEFCYMPSTERHDYMRSRKLPLNAVPLTFQGAERAIPEGLAGIILGRQEATLHKAADEASADGKANLRGLDF